MCTSNQSTKNCELCCTKSVLQRVSYPAFLCWLISAPALWQTEERIPCTCTYCTHTYGHMQKQTHTYKRSQCTYSHVHVCPLADFCTRPDSITHTWCKLQHSHSFTHSQAHADTLQVHTYHAPASQIAPRFPSALGAKIRTRGLKIHYGGMGGGEEMKGKGWAERSRARGGGKKENAEQAGMQGEESESWLKGDEREWERAGGNQKQRGVGSSAWWDKKYIHYSVLHAEQDKHLTVPVSHTNIIKHTSHICNVSSD